MPNNSIFQVIRDGWGDKAPRVNASPALPGRYLVYFPRGSGKSVSRRIESLDKREYLQELASSLSQIYGGGVIIRSAAEDVKEESVRAEAKRLYLHWQQIHTAAYKAEAPTLISKGPGLIERLIRDTLPLEARIITDDRDILSQLLTYTERWAPAFYNHLELSDGQLFERYDAVGAMEQALRPEVKLNGGGRLTIEPTEALTAIDVDCGVRSGAKRHALLAASIEAATAAAREIRRRNLTGSIVIDFPRLDSSTARQTLITEMRREMKDDSVAHKVVGITESGLMEITRQRRETPLLEALTELRTGAYAGRRPRLDALAFDIASEARLRVQEGARNITLFAAPALASYIGYANDQARGADDAAFGTWLGAGFAVKEETERRREDWTIKVE